MRSMKKISAFLLNKAYLKIKQVSAITLKRGDFKGKSGEIPGYFIVFPLGLTIVIL